MSFPGFLVQIRVLAVFLAVFVVSGQGIAQNKIYLSPGSSSGASEGGGETVRSKPRIYVAPGASSGSVGAGRVQPKPRVQFLNKTRPSSVVFTNDLSAYRDFEGMDPAKLYSFGGEPDSSRELMQIARAHQLPRVKSVLAMQKALDSPRPVPTIAPAGSGASVARSSVSVAGAKTIGKRSVQRASGSQANTIYVKPQQGKRAWPWKLWGKNR